MPAELDNAAIAERLEAFAGLLDLAGASPYTSRAYRRAAETIRETAAPILELVRQGRVQELRGVGPGIAARLTELAVTGTIAELDELQRDVRPELVGLGRMLGVAPKRMLVIAAALGVDTPDEFRRAAREGALSSVPGVGPATERKILDRLAADPGRPPRGLTINRARSLVEPIATALDGAIAGDPRRWADVSFELSIVVPTTQPGQVVEAFERLPQIVTVVERDDGSAVGVTVEGVPVVSPPAGAGAIRHRAPPPDGRGGVRRCAGPPPRRR